ncbi:MAG: DNA polymerase Y family protein [Lawsonella sp.]
MPSKTVSIEARTIACLFPEWPTTALLLETQQEFTTPVFITRQHYVVAANHAARQNGVAVGDKQRDAEAACPEALVAVEDPDRDARWFEEIVQRCFSVTPRMEILRPGLITITAAAVARFYGSEEQACEVLLTELEDAGIECHLGIADNVPAAIWAAPRDIQVAPFRTNDFVEKLPLAALIEEETLPYPETRAYLAETLSQMGCNTLGDVQRIPRRDIVQRFGRGARDVYDMLSGHANRKVLPLPVPQQMEVREECSPPLVKIDEAAFLARRLAVKLHAKLNAQGLCCTAVEIGATTTGHHTLTRVWRCEEPLSASAIADRMRWQIDGWFTARKKQHTTPSAALQFVWIAPVETHYAGEHQPDLWSGDTQQDVKRKKCVSRVQGLLGGAEVLHPVPSGGWGADSRIMWLPYGDEPTKDNKKAAHAPWEGKLLAPLPVHRQHQKIGLYDSSQQHITVSGRGTLSAPPHHVKVGNVSHKIINWAGPWTINDAWWSAHPERYALLQVAVHNNLFLLNCQQGTWYIEGEY